MVKQGTRQRSGGQPSTAEVRYFVAPWGKTLIVMSAIATTCCLGISVVLWVVIPGMRIYSPGFWLSLVPVLLTLAAVPFVVRGYSLGPAGLRVRRLFWDTPVALRGLREVRYEPGAIKGSLRVLGNGGLYSFCGWFWSRRLGFYRGYLTDGRRTVVLRLPRRTVVVSPDDPLAFVSAVRRWAELRQRES
jgi:hypothetical protein